MIKKRPSFVLFIALFFLLAFNSFGQQPEYFTDRLIIKFESDQKLQQIRSKLDIDPQNAVQQVLNQNGARTIQSLFTDRLKQSIRQRNLLSANDILRIREVMFSRNINPVQLAAKISSMPGVAYAEPRYIRQMSLTPNDPEIEKFVYAHNFIEAWDISQGSRKIVIAINDGGVGYTHTDLDDNLWVNQDEVPPTLRPQVDQNGDGTITSTEIYEYLQENGKDYNEDDSTTLEDALHEDSSFMDGIDTDNNNFTDDLFGWDFWASGGVDSPVVADNNPFHDGTYHGTHVAGIAAAETNNDTAIASASFNTTYMALKTGGTAEEPETIGFGFEGIVYAAENGADIINCSWGGESTSQAEKDVINFATEMGALVVAAAGNESNSQVRFPAAYDNVLSVGSVEPDGSLASYSNYGYKLDVLATGTNIRSTWVNNTLAEKTGTSMATPVVSGLAALVKEVHPGWSAERIGMQIRTSASFIDNANPQSYDNKLGHGSIDAFNAVNTNKPGLKIISYEFVNPDGEKLMLNEPGKVEITLTNYGNTTSGLELQLKSLNEEGVELSNPSQQSGSIATEDTIEVSFDITITDEFDLSETPTLRLTFLDGNQDYEDFNVIQYNNILYDVMVANNVKTSFGADGTVGFTEPLTQTGGVGFIPRTPDISGGYNEGENLLFEGGLMIEIDGIMYDAVREEGRVSRDFYPNHVFVATPNNSSMTGSTQFVTKSDSARKAIIDLKTYAFNEAGIRNAVFLEYTIRNSSDFVVMENVYAGLFNDWDIGNASNNNAAFSQADSILYLSDTTLGSIQPVAAVAHLGPISGALAIDNTIEGEQDSLTFGIYDGFTDKEKSTSLKSGTVRTNVQNTDVSAVVASGPYTIDPGAKVTVGFVYAFGDDVNQLRTQISEARSRNLFDVSPTGRAVPDEVPQRTELFQNYPNPFNSSTQLRIDLEQSTDVTLTVFDVLGRKVRVLADGEFEAGSYFIRFSAEQLSSGTYFVRLRTDYGIQSIPITFVK
jgi:subtilisin family serine protease